MAELEYFSGHELGVHNEDAIARDAMMKSAMRVPKQIIFHGELPVCRVHMDITRVPTRAGF